MLSLPKSQIWHMLLNGYFSSLKKDKMYELFHRSENVIIFSLWVVVIDKIWSERVKLGPKNPKWIQNSNNQVALLSIL